MRLAIIGTAGRKDDKERITAKLYDEMYDHVKTLIAKWGITTAVSGGAAVADHLAVRAFNDKVVDNLNLYLPAYFQNGKFVPNPQIQFNPGKTCNVYHENFSKSCHIDSLAEIDTAIKNNANVAVKQGFHLRNSEVAFDCDYLAAYTFGSGDVRFFTPEDEGYKKAIIAGLKDGGTAHTWGECYKAKEKCHFNLFQLLRT